MKQEEKLKLLSTLKEARHCITSMVESSGMVSKTFMSMMSLPKEFTEKKEKELEGMEDIIDKIDKCLNLLEKSD